MKRFLNAVFALGLFSFCGLNASADIIFTITGDDSDTVVDWSLSGAVTVNASIASQNNDDLLFPTSSAGAWDHLANVGENGIIGTILLNAPSITGAPSISINGAANIFDGISLNNMRFIDNAPGSDSFQFLFNSTALHPALSAGDTVAYGGSGTLDLGVAKSTLFVDGSYTGEQLLHASDTINLVVQSSTAVPEPSSLLLLAIGGVGFLAQRRRSHSQRIADREA